MSEFDPISVINPVVDIATGVTSGIIGQKEGNKARNQSDQELAANIALQREFAQNGIRWRVADAKAAGLHPLAALGSMGASFSPVSSVGGPDHSMSNMVKDMGQGISRAVNVMATPEEKAYKVLQLESMSLDNSLKKKELEGIDSPGTPGVDYSFDGPGISGQNTIQSDLRDAQIWSRLGFRGSPPHRVRPSQERGYRPDVAFTRTGKGAFPVIPESLAESFESDHVGSAIWRWRNSVINNFGSGRPPAQSDLPKGFDRWKWNWTMQEWQPFKRGMKWYEFYQSE